MIQRLSGIGMTSQRTRARMVERLRAQGIADEVVLAAMNDVPRHIFVDEAIASRAYEDVSLPIGHGQTISQPHTVARMTELARGGRDLSKARVLEIGTGCGYQSAVLSRVAKEVYSVERIAQLVAKARAHLRELRIHNVKIKYGDGAGGFADVAPFEAILMTAGATHIPQVLLEQLASGGRLVMPIGADVQRLTVVERTADGFAKTELEEVKFVPLLGGVA